MTDPAFVTQVADTMGSVAADLASLLQERDKLASEKAQLTAEHATLKAERDKLASDLEELQQQAKQAKKATELPDINLSEIVDHLERAGVIFPQEKQATIAHIRANPLAGMATVLADMAPLLRDKAARVNGRPVLRQPETPARREAFCAANRQ